MITLRYISLFLCRCCTKSSATFHLFRLLVLYHDPELCSFLDTKQISPDLYALTWVRQTFINIGLHV